MNFEKCQADGPIRDLYLLLRKLLEKSDWDCNRGEALLAAYESVRPLNPFERQDLFYRLSYPEKLWKIVNFYYNSGKAWIPEKIRKNWTGCWNRRPPEKIPKDSETIRS